jgi:hypothetical protein
MKTAFMLDYELNQPFLYIEKFQKLLTNQDLNIDMFKISDAGKEKKSPLDDKIDACDFIILRKPLTFLSSEPTRQKIQDFVIKKHKNILVTFSFVDYESLEIINDFLKPTNIQSSGIMVYDDKENLGSRRLVRFRKSNGCLEHSDIFKGVDEVVIPQAHYVYVVRPSKVLIRGNPSTRAEGTSDSQLENIGGNEIIVSAYNDDNAKIILMDSTLLNNKYIDKNTKFVKNVINWMMD